MKNRWNDKDAASYAAQEPVGLRVYTSRLLGAEEDLVLHGGGNTSVKGGARDVFDREIDVLYIKGSGWDLRTIEASGFPPVDLEYLQRLGNLEKLSDSEMMRQLRLALMDPTAPTPSVEAILHALIPHRFVDHSHADAVVAISNTPNGEKRLREIYGDQVLILPYIMPGFILARQVAEATRNLDWASIKGIVLMHHGIFTFAAEAQTSYNNMIELVSLAEAHLESAGCVTAINTADYVPDVETAKSLAALRKAAGSKFGAPVLVRLDHAPLATGFASLDNCADLATRGPLTPDHTIHAKAFAAIFDDDPLPGLQQFEQDYEAYFAAYDDGSLRCLDAMPRYGVWRNRGMVYLAGNLKRLKIVADITRHTVRAIQWGEAIDGWQALPREQLFEVEYWELEQAKLQSGASRAEFEGQVVLVTGAAAGIGRACVAEFTSKGAVVIALDIKRGFADSFEDAAVLALECDVTDRTALEHCLQQGVLHFGGIDVLVSNAGLFPPSESVGEITDATWDHSMELNLNSHMRVLRASLPYLINGFDPAVVIVASKNVPAPGPGAAAYSAAKAGLTQLARVTAMEWGADGIRVNVVHPNAVYDTELWTDSVLAERAARYGLSVEEYKTANVLQTEVTSADVARTISTLAGNSLAKTTGAQLPVDGGNERVI